MRNERDGVTAVPNGAGTSRTGSRKEGTVPLTTPLDPLAAVLLQPMKEDPPPGTKCRDKFLVQSVIITSERENSPLAELVSSPLSARECMSWAAATTAKSKERSRSAVRHREDLSGRLGAVPQHSAQPSPSSSSRRNTADPVLSSLPSPGHSGQLSRTKTRLLRTRNSRSTSKRSVARTSPPQKPTRLPPSSRCVTSPALPNYPS